MWTHLYNVTHRYTKARAREPPCPGLQNMADTVLTDCVASSEGGAIRVHVRDVFFYTHTFLHLFQDSLNMLIKNLQLLVLPSSVSNNILVSYAGVCLKFGHA
jgi:hypothetical protein